MKCPICGTAVPPFTDRCPDCGYRCRNAHTQTSAPGRTAGRATYTPPNATKKSRGCCFCGLIVLVPLILLIVAAMFGAVNFIHSEFSTEFFTDDFIAEPTFEDLIPESMPEPADGGCFVVADHTVMFLRENWDGSPVLRIPEQIDGVEITSIGAGCFAGCEELTTIVLPESITIISPMAFSGCTGLRGLYLHDGVEVIGADAFAGCKSLEAIYIPASVETISPGCFDDCASLLYIFYGGMMEDWNALYSGFVTPFTTAICLDGNYPQGADG
jgi:hypothetical protein